MPRTHRDRPSHSAPTVLPPTRPLAPAPAVLGRTPAPAGPAPTTAAETPSAEAQSVGAGGQSLDAQMQTDMGAAFGHDFSRVRVHADGEAGASALGLGAAAYATGRDLFFAPGLYDPHSAGGKHLLAHELTHVVQQDRFGASGPQARKAVSDANDPAEREAEDVAGRAAQGERVQVRQAPGATVSRWGLPSWASNAWHGATNAASSAWHGATRAASGAAHGVGDFASHTLRSAGRLVNNAGHMASSAAHGLGHFATNAWHGAQRAGSSLVHGAQHFESGLIHGASGLVHSAGGLAHRVAGGVGHAWDNARHFAGSAGRGLSHLAGRAAHGAEHFLSDAAHGAGHLAHRVAGGVGHAWNNARHFAGDAVHGAEHALSGAARGVGHLASNAWHGAGRAVHGMEHLASGGLHSLEHLASGGLHGLEHLASGGLHGLEHLASGGLHGMEHLASRGLHGAEHLGLGALQGVERAGSGLAHGGANLAARALHGGEDLASSAWGGVSRTASGAWDGVKGAVGPLPSLHDLGDAASEQFAPLINAKTPWEALKAEGSIAYNGMKTAGGWVKSAGEAATHGIDWAEDKASGAAHWAADQTNGIPVLSQLAHGAAGMVDMQSQLTGGVLKAGTGLVEGIAGMVVNPVDTLKGLETMGEHIPTMGGLIPNPLKAAHGLLNVATGGESWAELQKSLSPEQSQKEDGQFWKAVGGGLIGGYSDSWKKGKYGDVIGHAGGDIASFFVGAGEANAVAKMGEAGKLAEVAKVGEAAKLGDAAKIGDAARVGDAAKVSEGLDAAKLGDGARADAPLASGAGAGTKPAGQPWGDIGLGKKSHQERFARDMEGLQQEWPGLTADERQQRLTGMINRPLGRSGVKGVGNVGPKAGGGGVFDFRTWDIGADGGLMGKDHLSPEEFADLGNTVYHEGRHTEQWYAIARNKISELNAGKGLRERLLPTQAERAKQIEQVAGDMGYRDPAQHGALLDAVEHAHTPWKRATYFGKQKKFGKAMDEAVYGSGAPHRNATLRGLPADDAAAQAAHSAHKSAAADRAWAAGNHATAAAERDAAHAAVEAAENNPAATAAEKLAAARKAAAADAKFAATESHLAAFEAQEAAAQAARDRALAQYQGRYGDYRGLPEEADAWGLGDDMGERIKEGQPATATASAAGGGGASGTTGAPRIPAPGPEGATLRGEGGVAAPAMVGNSMADLEASLGGEAARGLTAAGGSPAASDAAATIADAKAAEAEGKMAGVGDWESFTRAKNPPVDPAKPPVDWQERGEQVLDDLAELKEGKRLTGESGPGEVVHVGGDARAPLDPVTGEKAPSFDIQVQDAAGAVTRNVETKRLRKPVGRVDDLTPGVKHAAYKVPSATTGTREASISVAVEPVEKLRAGRVRHMAPDGTWHIVEKDGSVRQRGSLMDKVAGHLPSIKNSHLLDRVNVVGPDGGVIGVFENQQGAWVRVQ